MGTCQKINKCNTYVKIPKRRGSLSCLPTVLKQVYESIRYLPQINYTYLLLALLSKVPVNQNGPCKYM